MSVDIIRTELKNYLETRSRDIDHLYPEEIFRGNKIYPTVDYISTSSYDEHLDTWIFKDPKTDKFYKLELEYGSFGGPDYDYALDSIVEVVQITKTITIFEELF